MKWFRIFKPNILNCSRKIIKPARNPFNSPIMPPRTSKRVVKKAPKTAVGQNASLGSIMTTVLNRPGVLDANGNLPVVNGAPIPQRIITYRVGDLAVIPRVNNQNVVFRPGTAPYTDSIPHREAWLVHERGHVPPAPCNNCRGIGAVPPDADGPFDRK